MNVWSSTDGVVVEAELPGIDPKAVDVSVLGDELTLTGKLNDDVVKGITFTRRERPSGAFERRLKLGFQANAEGVKANYTKGVLRITIPRAEEEKPKRIAIDAV
jgi:HSP20 family protein